jgi:predicted HicB family RNase H-like nuclease
MRKVVVLRIPVDLHRAVRTAAKRSGQSFNAYSEAALRRLLQNEVPSRRRKS